MPGLPWMNHEPVASVFRYFAQQTFEGDSNAANQLVCVERACNHNLTPILYSVAILLRKPTPPLRALCPFGPYPSALESAGRGRIGVSGRPLASVVQKCADRLNVVCAVMDDLAH